MGAARKYAVIDPATGKLDRRIFSDQAIYDDEMEKIFGRAWLMSARSVSGVRPITAPPACSSRTTSTTGV